MAERTGNAWRNAAIAAGAIGGGFAIWSAIAARAAERAVPPDGDFVEVPGARIHYVDLGPRDAPVLLMVHGLMGQLRNFTYALTDRLAADYRIVAIDRPGWGHSSIKGRRPNILEQGRIVVAVADALRLERPVLVGHSLGGAVVLAAALAAPRRFAGLAMIAPLTQPVETAPAQFAGMVAPAGVREFLSWTLAVPSAVLTGPVVAQAVFAPDLVPLDFATRGGGALSVRPQSYRAGSFEVMNAKPEVAWMAEHYGELALPSAILFGRGDRVLDPAIHGEATAAAIPGCRLERVDGGHMLPVTHPEVTAAFLRGVTVRA
jgi:pimeloyl-ACP methyl ester carboxylesterase